MNNDQLLNNIKKIREEKQLTQEEVAKAINLTRSPYTKIENGYQPINWFQLQKIAELFEMGVNDVIYAHLSREERSKLILDEEDRRKLDQNENLEIIAKLMQRGIASLIEYQHYIATQEFEEYALPYEDYLVDNNIGPESAVSDLKNVIRSYNEGKPEKDLIEWQFFSDEFMEKVKLYSDEDLLEFVKIEDHYDWVWRVLLKGPFVQNKDDEQQAFNSIVLRNFQIAYLFHNNLISDSYLLRHWEKFVKTHGGYQGRGAEPIIDPDEIKSTLDSMSLKSPYKESSLLTIEEVLESLKPQSKDENLE